MSAKEFGQRLRFYRERRIDPASSQAQNGRGRLTQARFGELVGRKLGLDSGYTGAAVSEWELGKSAIHAHDRNLLLAIVAVLKGQGRLLTPREADELLMAGGYRPLDPLERAQVFPDQPDSEEPPRRTEFVFRPGEMFDRWRVAFQRTPQGWLDWLGARTQRVRASDALRAALWLLAWAATAWMLNRCLSWPYADAVYGLGLSGAAEAALTWVGVNLLVPMVVGALAQPWAGAEWQARPTVPAWPLRAYTLQGAWIGYQIAAFTLFGAALLSYHAGLDVLIRPVRPLLEGFAALWPLAFGYAAALAVPDNLWCAYNRLSWSDGGIFFAIAALAPAWAAFFYWQADFLLAPFWGLLTLLLALAGAPALAVFQERHTGSTVLPVHVWIVIYGLILVPAQYQQTHNLFEAATLAGLLALLAFLSRWGHLPITLSGALACAALLAFIWLARAFNEAWWPWAAALALVGWWLLGFRRLRMSWTAWLLALAGVGLSVLLRQSLLDLSQALLLYLGLLFVLLGLAWRRRK